jgi:hypothetical protein
MEVERMPPDKMERSVVPMAEKTGINRQYKDRLFKFIFGNPEHKEWTLALYNAINGSFYDNPDDIELNTIEDVLYMGMKNDVSFIITETINFYEQQSSFNPNVHFVFLDMLRNPTANTSRITSSTFTQQHFRKSPHRDAFAFITVPIKRKIRLFSDLVMLLWITQKNLRSK